MKAAFDIGPRPTKLIGSTAVSSIGSNDKSGRPTLLSCELNEKLRTMIQSMRIWGTPINIHIVRGVLTGLVRSDVERYGQYLDFQVTRA